MAILQPDVGFACQRKRLTGSVVVVDVSDLEGQRTRNAHKALLNPKPRSNIVIRIIITSTILIMKIILSISIVIMLMITNFEYIMIVLIPSLLLIIVTVFS